MKKSKSDIFWVGYSDLMSSLFFVMLVLFILAFSITQEKIRELQSVIAKNDKANEDIIELNKMLNEANERLEVEAAEARKIRSISRTLRELEKGGLYIYNASCKRFELKRRVQFGEDSAVIPKDQKKDLLAAGKELKRFLEKYKGDSNIKFMILIEGRAARHEDLRKNLKYANNVKDLSYSRSLSLYQLWQGHGIDLNSANSEVMISGSGFDGLCRYKGNDEEKNKQIIIQIIPYLTR